MLRNRLLLEDRWAAIHKAVCKEVGGKKVCMEALLRRSWSLVLGTMESQLMRELEDMFLRVSGARLHALLRRPATASCGPVPAAGSDAGVGGPLPGQVQLHFPFGGERFRS